MPAGMTLLVLALLGGGYATVRLLDLFAATPIGSLGAAYLVTTALAALFTLLALVGAVLVAAAWSVRRRIEEGNRQRERLIGQMNLFELRMTSVEQKAVQAGWAAIDRQVRERGAK